MIDKSIPYYNIIMLYKCVLGKSQDNIFLPGNYRFSTFHEGDERRWAEMEVENNDFDTYDNAVRYFREKYMSDISKLKGRFIGVRDSNNYLCGSVICWFDDKNGDTVATVHWLIVDPKVQHKGIGEALVRKLIQRFKTMGIREIYLHTQPWSYKAISIYSKCGFRIICSDTFRNYVNQGIEGLQVVKQYLDKVKYVKLENEKID